MLIFITLLFLYTVGGSTIKRFENHMFQNIFKWCHPAIAIFANIANYFSFSISTSKPTNSSVLHAFIILLQPLYILFIVGIWMIMLYSVEQIKMFDLLNLEFPFPFLICSSSLWLKGLNGIRILNISDNWKT